MSPEALAFALVNKEFSRKERLSIRYDCKTEEDFINEFYSADFPEHILRQLITEMKEVSRTHGNELDRDPHPVCDCGC